MKQWWDKCRDTRARTNDILVGVNERGDLDPMPLADAVATAGHYEPVTNGDPADPQPLYTFNADDCPEFMMLWIEE